MTDPTNATTARAVRHLSLLSETVAAVSDEAGMHLDGLLAARRGDRLDPAACTGQDGDEAVTGARVGSGAFVADARDSSPGLPRGKPAEAG